MRHFVFAMEGAAQAPAGGGNTSSWFFYYKWGQFNGSEEVFVPFPEAALDENALPGSDDILWFFLDGALLGAAKIARTLPSTVVGYEVWYRTDDIRRTDVAIHGYVPQTGLVIGTGEVERLNEICKFIGVT